MAIAPIPDEQIRRELRHMLEQSKANLKAAMTESFEAVKAGVEEGKISDEHRQTLVAQIDEKLAEADETYEQFFAFIDRQMESS